MWGGERQGGHDASMHMCAGAVLGCSAALKQPEVRTIRALYIWKGAVLAVEGLTCTCCVLAMHSPCPVSVLLAHITGVARIRPHHEAAHTKVVARLLADHYPSIPHHVHHMACSQVVQLAQLTAKGGGHQQQQQSSASKSMS